MTIQGKAQPPGSYAPQRRGAVGALLHEYERAAADFVVAAARIRPEDFAQPHIAATGDLKSYRDIVIHVVASAWDFADHLEDALAHADRGPREHPEVDVETPARVGPALTLAISHTEQVLAPIEGASDQELAAIRIETRWGRTYDVEQLLEHAVVHLLRHRRQIFRWFSRARREALP
jgi:uncharacterized damage-inducible protein DinB